MKLIREQSVSIEFASTETNAARRLLLRLVSEFGFAARDKHGAFSATIHGRTYAIRFRVGKDGGSELVAENAAAEELLPGICTALTLEWQDPAKGPTSRRRAVVKREAEILGRLLGC